MATRELMLEYRKEDRSHNSPPSVQLPPTATRRAVNPPSASRAARAQSTGFARLNALAKSLSGSDLDSASDSSPPKELTEQEKGEAECRAVAEDERIVDEELGQYEAEQIIDESSPEFEDLDLLRYWEIVDDLLGAGRTQELEELVNSSWGRQPYAENEWTKSCGSVRVDLSFYGNGPRADSSDQLFGLLSRMWIQIRQNRVFAKTSISLLAYSSGQRDMGDLRHFSTGALLAFGLLCVTRVPIEFKVQRHFLFSTSSDYTEYLYLASTTSLPVHR
ncbi:hypothetical protein DFH09DRAFT_1070504 [Mycena vulgaris]|nr:hypothetical protein DFH09DRAFT_1070504 [Mycena vulgaris]